VDIQRVQPDKRRRRYIQGGIAGGALLLLTLLLSSLKPAAPSVDREILSLDARAVVGDPAILLADEPTGNLDSTNGEAVMELLRTLHRSGATVCMVTHDPRYAKHADRSIHLFDGRVVDESRAPST